MISMPKKRSMTETFLNHAQALGMTFESKLLDEEEFLSSPLEKDSKKYFEDLKSCEIMLYTIYKK